MQRLLVITMLKSSMHLESKILNFAPTTITIRKSLFCVTLLMKNNLYQRATLCLEQNLFFFCAQCSIKKK